MMIRVFGLCNCSTICIEATLPDTRLPAKASNLPHEYLSLQLNFCIWLLLYQQRLATIQGCCSHSYQPLVQWNGSFFRVSNQPNFTRLWITTHTIPFTHWETLQPELKTCSSLVTEAWCLSPGWLSWAMPTVHIPAMLYRACSRLVIPTFFSQMSPQSRNSVGTRTWHIYFLRGHAMPARRD